MASGAPPLKQLFQSQFDFKVDKKLADQVIRWRYIYESRDQNAEALNTPLIGVVKFGFYENDRQALFDILGISKEDFKRAIRQSSIDNSFKVASDDFNLLTIWAVHKFFNSSLDARTKSAVCRALWFMMLVKFYSSLVRHFLPHGAKRDVMEATIDSLNDKFDIKHEETSTWKLIMEKRAEELMDPQNIHFNAIKTFIPDTKVVYVITDSQTRLRTKVRLIMTIYYDFVNKKIAISETGMTQDDAEGEKIVKELKNSFDGMIVSVCNRVLNVQQFIKPDYIKVTCKLIPNVRADMMRSLLMQFSSRATIQYQKHKQDAMDRSGKLYEGYHILLQNLIQRTYRKCIMDKVNLKSRLEILKKTMDIYRSSRILDPIIATVKDSVSVFVNSTRLSSREATLASLKIAFIVYIIFLTFDCD